MQPTRRQVLAGSLAAAATACTPNRAPQPVNPDPDTALKAAAVLREQQLLAAYDSTLLRYPELWSELSSYRDDHAAHLQALHPTPSPSPAVVHTGPSPSPAAAAVLARERASLAATERAAATAHAQATAGASDRLALLLASLAACEASHAALL